MAQINDEYLKLPGSYLFADIAHKVNAFKENHPEVELIRLGIGDVTRPLPPSVIKALHKAVDEQATAEGFRGYGPEQGYRFLREAIAQGDFASRGVEIDPDDIFVSDGAKCDLGNFQELFGRGNVIAVTDPVYPVYVDSNVMGGRAGTFDGKGAWSGIVYLPCSAENGFVPALPPKRPDVIYLCLPNNPTGTALSRSELQRWVDYARGNQCVILFDAAYEAYIREKDIPHSIYELEGAKEVAVEFRSFSKPAGFTGLRCGYVVVPETVKARAADGRMLPLKPLWNRRQTTKYNGCPYIVQRAAEAVYSDEGRRQIKENINCYLGNAKKITDGLESINIRCFGGRNSPYIWFEVPNGLTSWQMFDRLLNTVQVVGTPGSGFGTMGEGYFRLTAFAGPKRTLEAVERIKNGLK